MFFKCKFLQMWPCCVFLLLSMFSLFFPIFSWRSRINHVFFLFSFSFSLPPLQGRVLLRPPKPRRYVGAGQTGRRWVSSRIWVWVFSRHPLKFMEICKFNGFPWNFQKFQRNFSKISKEYSINMEKIAKNVKIWRKIRKILTEKLRFENGAKECIV